MVKFDYCNISDLERHSVSHELNKAAGMMASNKAQYFPVLGNLKHYRFRWQCVDSDDR